MSNIKEPTRVESYTLEKSGFSAPFRVLSLPQAKVIVEQLIPQLEQTPMTCKHDGLTTRHLDNAQIYALATNKRILDRLAPVLGDRIVVWQSHFFIKDSDQARVPWHQDAYHWPLQPKVAISAWLALTKITEASGCLKVVPGLNRKLLPTRRVVSPCHRLFREEAVMSDALLERAIDMTLEPGEAFLFDSFTPHASFVNHSSDRRIGLALRYTRSDVVVGVNHPLIYLARENGVWVETARSHINTNQL